MEKLPHASVKKRDMGLAGAIIVISQLISNVQSSNKVSEEIIKFKDEYHQSQVDLEKFFVRKSELSKVVKKLDKMDDRLSQMNQKIESLKDHEYSFNDDECIQKTDLKLIQGI